MIEENSLKEIFRNYNIDYNKVINKNYRVLDKSFYFKVKQVLKFLIGELKISASNIEKCPSILYLNVDMIKENYEFLKSEKINILNVESCLHVLSTDSQNLKETYKYVEENYGIEAINKVTSVLAVEKSKIIEFENLNIPNISKKDIISIAVGINELKDIKAMLHSEEYEKHPELFTSTTLAFAKIEDIKAILQSEEYKKHPKLFTSETLAHAKIEDIKAMLHSEEYEKHPELFTSTTLAFARIEDIKELLKLPYWKDDKLKNLLTSSIITNSKNMLKKLPITFKLAQDYDIADYLTTRFLLKSPSQNYALLTYLIDNNIPLIVNNKLNVIFNMYPNVMKKKYNIDLNELIKKYSFDNYQNR